jgi:hypothetical protein
MKAQFIISFLFLHAQTVLSLNSAVPQEEHTALPKCALPCKAKVQLGSVAMKKCLEVKCGAQYAASFAAENGGGRRSQRDENACKARCNRLRFGPQKQEQCIQDCDSDSTSARKASFGTDKEDFRGNERACVARCQRLRFSEHRQKQCIDDCKTDSTHAEMSSDIETDVEKRNGSTGDLPENAKACVARCQRLRFSQHRQDQCIKDCKQDSGAKESSNFDADEEERKSSSSAPGKANACVARCQRLRFSPHRQEQCIEDCDENDNSHEKATFDMDEEDNDSEPTQGNETSCVARCKRLRFGQQKQDQCIDDCGREKEIPRDTEDYGAFAAESI